jgi:hypothetical protein
MLKSPGNLLASRMLMIPRCLPLSQLLLGARAHGLALGALLLFCAPAGAQNLLINGDFESAPFGPTNWTVGYLHGGPDDWEIKDRSRGGARRSSTFYGGYFRLLSQKICHAYFSQTVSNLTPGYAYNFVGHMKEDWWKSALDPLRDKYLVYIELIGGLGTPLPCGDGRSSVIATNNLTDSDGNTDTDIDPPYTYPTIIWRPFYAQQTPDAEGKIEVRLHYNKVSYTIYDKCWISAASFDDCSLTR